MKKIIFTLCVILLAGMSTMSARSGNDPKNVDRQPAWGPTGYDYAGFYYLPDLNIYFDVDNSSFYYQSGSKWVSEKYLPEKYSKYDFYSLYKVVINDKQPWNQNSSHKKEYSKYKNNKTQNAIRNSNDSKYSQSKKNTTSWVNDSKNNNNNNNKGNNNNSKNNNKNNNNSKNNGQRK